MTTAPERPRVAPRRIAPVRTKRAEIEAPVRPKPRAGRTGGEPVWSLWTEGDLCGVCFGHRAIWCDGCCGFDGCALCKFTFKRPCPICVGGNAEPIKW
jgi:hypothetical protein